MRRRQFIAGLGAAAWPFAGRGQQAERVRRIGFIVSALAADDPLGQARVAVFVQGLQQLGWTVGRNVRMDYRWPRNDADRLRRDAEELVALAPDVILAGGTPALLALQQATRTLPIVFANVNDPVGSGIVESLARPGGNATGFMNIEFGQSAKWLELLKQIAPRVTRVAVLRSLIGGTAQLAAIQAVAPLFGVEVSSLNVRDTSEIERGVTAFARTPNGGLIVTIGVGAGGQRDRIISLAAQLQLPAIYPSRTFATDGGLISYGSDPVDLYRQAAGYVDRILKGEKPADLPVQAPTKYQMAINLKAAKALGIALPPTLLARADEVIE
jgi:putative ABC transport system substrate-binding protein